jgi:hypothetical protein
MTRHGSTSPGAQWTSLRASPTRTASSLAIRRSAFQILVRARSELRQG